MFDAFFELREGITHIGGVELADAADAKAESIQTRPCVFCGVPFPATHWRKRSCGSAACRRERMARNQRAYEARKRAAS